MNGKDKILKFYKKLENVKIVAIDTSIFIYHFEIDLRFFDLTTALFSLFSEEKFSMVTSTVTLAETLTKPFANKDEIGAAQLQLAFAQMKNLRICPIDNDLAITAAMIRSQYQLRLPDAFQLAAAKICGAKIFVTNDLNLKRVKDFEVICLSDFCEIVHGILKVNSI